MALIFPALPGLAWSVTKSPTFQTRIQRAVSGRELRALDYPFPLWQFTLVFDLLRDKPAAGYDELRTLMGFYMLCQGAFGTFLFPEPIVAPNVVEAIYLDGIVQDLADYSVDPSTGLVTFTMAPHSGLIITADYSYYFRCRFIDDSYAFENFM